MQSLFFLYQKQAAKQALRNELEASTKAREALRSEARDMKARLEVTSPDAIEARITELEVSERAGRERGRESKREGRRGGRGGKTNGVAHVRAPCPAPPRTRLQQPTWAGDAGVRVGLAGVWRRGAAGARVGREVHAGHPINWLRKKKHTSLPFSLLSLSPI